MKKSKWIPYKELAWTEHIIAPPEDYSEETELISKVIREQSQIKVNTLLHLGCGAGGNDYTFKRYFQVTGVDISDEMLEIARKLNPECTYMKDDMREIRLENHFDVIVIPDSIGHMTTLLDLRKTIQTAYNHLKSGGMLIIATVISEEFRENNFVYTGSKGNIEVTLFENNYIPDASSTTYEATVVYLIRRDGVLEIHADTENIGVFTSSTWFDLLGEIGFNVKSMELTQLYDRYLAGDGKYSMTIFVCSKPF